MAYRYDKLFSHPTGLGRAKNTWHNITVTPSSIGPLLDIAGYVIWSAPPRASIQVAGYAALTWPDTRGNHGRRMIGETRPILTPDANGLAGLHRFDDAEVDRYRDAAGWLPTGTGIIYYVMAHLPAMSWELYGATS